jgi:hypothetical protein
MHKKTKQKLQLKNDCGDIISAYVLDDNLNKIINENMSYSGNVYKTVVCHKNNLMEILQ